MNRREERTLLVVLVLTLCCGPVLGQLSVTGGEGEFSEFLCDGGPVCGGGESPLSGDIDDGGDLFVEFDLEVADVIYGLLFASREPTTATFGQAILNLLSTESVTFIIDRDNSSGSADVFGWYEDGTLAPIDQLAELEANGDFEIRGAYSSGVMFDLAETFLAVEGLEPGDVVRIDPLRANRVVHSDGAGDSAVVGVVSGAPAIKLGGTLFAVEDLDAWGEDVKQRFLAQELALTQAAVGRNPELAVMQRTLEELASAGRSDSGGDSDGAVLPDRAESLEGRLQQAALDLFAEQNFVSVALAGRVPIKVEGPVSRGDYLTASHVPGLARQATGPGAVVGVALEDLPPGATTVMMLVQNGWYGGKATTLASTDELHERLAEQQSVIVAQNEQIESLERLAASVAARMVSLERRLSSLDGQVLRSAYRPAN